MKVKSPISEGRVAEKLYNYIHQKVKSLEDYKWMGKTYAYKKLDIENCPYNVHAVVRWEVDRTKTRKDVIDLTFSLELALGKGGMLVPIWNLTFQDIGGINGIDSAFQKINEEINDFKEQLEF